MTVQTITDKPSETPRRARLADIVTLASKLTDIDESRIYSAERFKPCARARYAVVWVARQQSPQPSFPQIGRSLGGRDHSTAVHALQQAEKLRACDAQWREMTDKLLFLAAETPPFIREREAQQGANTPIVVTLPKPDPKPKPPKVQPKNGFDTECAPEHALAHDAMNAGSVKLAKAVARPSLGEAGGGLIWRRNYMTGNSAKREESARLVARIREQEAYVETLRVSRDSCTFCGTRGDLKCPHNAKWEAA